MAAAISERTFGVELEVVGITPARAADVLRAAGIACDTGYYSSTNRDGRWLSKSDGSVSGPGGSAEIVSPILRGEPGIAQARAVCAALTAAGATVNTTCGFHVHVGAGDFDAPAMKRLVKQWVKYEDSIDLMLAPSRRRDANRYCGSMLRALSTGCGYNATVADRCAAAFATLDRCTTLEQVKSAIGTRYVKLNVQSFWRHGTVEVRAHQGTVNADKVEAWVRFAVALVDFAKAAKAVAPRLTGDHSADVRLGWMFDRLKVSGNARRFLTRRAAALAAA